MGRTGVLIQAGASEFAPEHPRNTPAQRSCLRGGGRGVFTAVRMSRASTVSGERAALLSPLRAICHHLWVIVIACFVLEAAF